MEIATEIARQIGGRAFYMMGTRSRVAVDNGLWFDVRGSVRVNRVQVTLDASDTYTVKFMKQRGQTCKTVSESDGVYCDMLQGVIEQATGLALSL